MESHLVAVTQSFYTQPSRVPVKPVCASEDAGLIGPDRTGVLASKYSGERKRAKNHNDNRLNFPPFVSFFNLSCVTFAACFNLFNSVTTGLKLT